MRSKLTGNSYLLWYKKRGKVIFLHHKKITISLGISVIFLIASIAFEISLRYFVGLGDPILYYSYPLFGYRLLPNQEVKRFHGSLIKVNNLGLRSDFDWDDNIENKILFLGDSVTYGGSYISNDELFTNLSLKNIKGYIGGNAGINGWGVENIYGLIVNSEFLPSKIYVTVLIENDFYRGLTRLEGKPYWCHKPRYAFMELLHFVYNKEEIKQYINWEKSANDDEIKRVVDSAAYKLHIMDQFLKSKGFKHLIFISPTREQVVNADTKDKYVEEYLKKYNINAIYISDLLNKKDNIQKKLVFIDHFHLTKYGHQLWAEIIGPEIYHIINN